MPKPVYIPKKPAKKPGRPTVWTPERRAALLGAIEQGMPLKQAAAIAGVSYDTLNHWQNRGENESAPEEYRQFCQLLRRSQAVAMQVHLSVIHQAARRGDWRASAWMLERRHPEDFARPQQFEHSGPGGKPLMQDPDVNHEVLVRMKKQQGIVELLKKFGGIIKEQRLQLEENAKAEREAATLQTPLVLNTQQATPKRAPLRE